MIKLREPFSQKVHLHIRQDMLQRLWDKYVPEASQQYGQIELVYRKNALGDMEKQPEQIKLLLHLLLKNKQMQLNLMQYPAPVKIFQNQMRNNLRRIERYYTVQLKCSNPTLYRTVKQYFTLLEQAQADRRRYQEWQKNYQEIEKQKDEYRLISLFSEKLRDYLAQYSVNTLRTMEREFVSSLSEIEYQTLTEEFYHQVMNLENVDPQVVIWKENKTEMLSEIDRLAPETIQQMWKQMKDMTSTQEQESLWIAEKGSQQDIQDSETLRAMEKELLYSLLETEYRTLAERLIWQEKPELIAYFKSCEKDQCKEIVKKLEKDTYIRQVLSSLKKQSAKKKLVSAAYKLEQKEFSLFYWQVVDLKAVNPQIVIWKKSRAQMLRSLDELGSESVKKVWTQMESVEPVKGNKHIFTKKLLQLQKQYQQNESRSFREQIAVILEENALENITDIVDIEQLVQDISISEYTEKPADVAKELEFEFGEREYPVLWDRAYQVIRNLEREQEIRRERIERQQVQVVETYQDVYHEILRTGNILTHQQEDTVQYAERIFREQYQEQLTREEIRNICEWSQALLEVHSAEQGVSSFSPNQMEQQELIYVVKEINDYIEEQHEFGERLILHWQEDGSKDERIKKLLIYIRQLDERQRAQFIHYLADMICLSVQLSSQKKIRTVLQLDRMESVGLPIQRNQQESVKKLLRIEDRELAKKLLQIEDREFAKSLIQIEDRELIEKLLQMEDREFAERILQIEDRELIGKLLRVEDIEFAKNLLQIEDIEFVKNLLQIGDREFVEKLLQNDDRQLLDVSYRNLWDLGEALLFYPKHQQEWEDADILAIPPQEAFSSEEAKQDDVQTQVIRRQIEIAKDRNRLQSLIRQINHQADIQLVYADVQLRMPQVQTVLHSIEQLDEKQYGVLVKELVQIIQLQKLSYEEPNTADTDVPTEEENNLYVARETDALLLHSTASFAEQSVQGHAYGFDGKLLRIEDKEFIEKLLQVEDREFAKKLLRIEDREFVEKLLQNDDRQLPDVSYRNLWEWGEALLFYPEHRQEDADILANPQQEAFSSEEEKQEDKQTQIVHQQKEIEKARNHLQSLIRQINHRADVRLVYTDAQLSVPQIQDLLQYIRQLDVRQYGAFVKELAQVTMIQKLSYNEPVINFPEASAVLLEQRMMPYPILERYIQNYEEQRQLALYRDIREVEQKIFSQDYGKENRKYVTGSNDAGNDIHGTLEYAQITTYEKKLRENRYQPQELEYSVQKASTSEEDQQRNELRMQRENAQIKSAQEQLDKKLKEVEHQLKKVEDSTKVKEDVKTFAEQVKQQLYEELHVEKLRRGLI